MKRNNDRFDCAQVLILPGVKDALNAEAAVHLIRTRQFWHVVVSGAEAETCARALRSHPGMPNILTETSGSAAKVKELLGVKGIVPRTIAVTQDRLLAYAEAFPEAKLFCCSDLIRQEEA